MLWIQNLPHKAYHFSPSPLPWHRLTITPTHLITKPSLYGIIGTTLTIVVAIDTVIAVNTIVTLDTLSSVPIKESVMTVSTVVVMGTTVVVPSLMAMDNASLNC